MANKTKELQRKQQLRQRKWELFNETCNKTRTLHIACAAICALTLLLFFVDFAEVYNTGYGVEVRVSGWSFFVAGFTGEYSSGDSIYGDLAVPFYYYAKSWCKGVGALAIIAVFITFILVALETVIVLTRKHSLTYIAVALGFIDAIFLLVTFIVALSMKNGRILSVYCGGNPSCSIRSLAILPFLAALAYTALGGVIGVKLILARKILE